MKRRIKLNAVVILLAITVMVLFPYRLFRVSAGLLDDALEVVGIVFILGGQLLRVSARGHKALSSANGHHLVQDGPYALVRNPMYLGIILIGWGVVLFVFQVWVFAIFAALFLIRYIHLFSIEEKHLMQLFPKEFPGYMRRVPRLSPRLSMLFSTDVAEYLPVHMSWLRREWFSISVILLSVLTVEGFENVRMEGWFAALLELSIFTGIVCVYVVFIWMLSIRYERLKPQRRHS